MGFSFRAKIDRIEHRVQVVPAEIRGLISQGSKQQPFLIWDVSESGVGVWVSEAIPKDEKVVITIGQPYLVVVNCEVIWAESLGPGQGHRCGLRSLDKSKAFDTMLQSLLAASK